MSNGALAKSGYSVWQNDRVYYDQQYSQINEKITSYNLMILTGPNILSLDLAVRFGLNLRCEYGIAGQRVP